VNIRYVSAVRLTAISL